MAYLGNAPARSFISFERQVFTIVNSQTAYTLSHSVTNENDIRLVINNIVQEPGSGKAYTASGTTLTLSAALTNGTDEMYCVFLGRAVATNAPAAGSVGLSQLSATGTKSSSTFLRGDNTFATAGVAGISSSADATAITIDSNEQVGIGTGSPLEKLHIETSSGDADALLHAAEDNSGSDARLFLKTTNTSATPSLFFGDSANDSVGFIKYANNGNSMQFGTNAAERMRLDTADVLIGSTSSFTGQGDDGAFLSSTGGIFDFARNVGGGSSTFRVSGSSGEVRVQGDGDLINTNNSYGAISDRQLKENEVEANSQWNDIKALQIKNYNLISQPNETHLGVIAQDLEASGMNSLVNNNEDELFTENDVLPKGKNIGDIKDKGYKSVKYSVLYMKSIKALQEAMEKIETLEDKVTALENA